MMLHILARLVGCLVLAILCDLFGRTFGADLSSDNGVRLPADTYLHRSSFPSDFKFGALTMALKHEGAPETVVEGLKVDSIWDVYAPEGIVDGTVPYNCGDEYYRYKEDIDLAADLGMDTFRTSIAWTRIFPNASKGAPNADAIAHYNDVLGYMLARGLEPHVTLWAADHPQALEDAYGGMLSPSFQDDFVRFANVCFSEFGDKVKYWITFDEPNDFAGLGYASTDGPPGRCSTPSAYGHGNCTKGNSSTEPYLVAHNILLAHAAASKLYKSVYQSMQEGFIGISLWFKWYEPLNESDSDDIAASQRAQDFLFGWFMDPLTYGQYPATMRALVGPVRLPSFSDKEAADIRNSWDFVGINMVTATYVTVLDPEIESLGYYEDMRIQETAYRDGVLIGEPDTIGVECIVPWSVSRIINYMKSHYKNPPMYITEIGWNVPAVPFENTINDTQRLYYFHSYYSVLSEAIRDGGNVLGLFAWSLIDGFEYIIGLSVRFGLFYVDEEFKRYPRFSAFWHQQFLDRNRSSIYMPIHSHKPIHTT